MIVVAFSVAALDRATGLGLTDGRCQIIVVSETDDDDDHPTIDYVLAEDVANYPTEDTLVVVDGGEVHEIVRVLAYLAYGRTRRLKIVSLSPERAREARFESTRRTLVYAPLPVICGATDVTGLGHLPELPDVASYLGVSYVQLVTERDGRRKLVIGGRTTPSQVEEFMRRWGPAQGLTGIYGDPARGFAGGYLPEI